MKKSFMRISALIMSAALLARCGDGKPDGGTASVEEEVDNSENASAPEESRGRIDKEDEEESKVSGSLFPVVSGSISPISENEVAQPVDLVGNTAKGEELWAMVSSGEEAMEIAELYDIELVLYEQGVATYHTEEDPKAVVQRGRENGWPLIAVNHTDNLIE